MIHVFRVQNRIKTEQRSRLGENKVLTLMRIASYGETAGPVAVLLGQTLKLTWIFFTSLSCSWGRQRNVQRLLLPSFPLNIKTDSS